MEVDAAPAFDVYEVAIRFAMSASKIEGHAAFRPGRASVRWIWLRNGGGEGNRPCRSQTQPQRAVDSVVRRFGWLAWVLCRGETRAIAASGAVSFSGQDSYLEQSCKMEYGATCAQRPPCIISSAPRLEDLEHDSIRFVFCFCMVAIRVPCEKMSVHTLGETRRGRFELPDAWCLILPSIRPKKIRVIKGGNVCGYLWFSLARTVDVQHVC